MRKKVNLMIILVLTVFLLSLALVACSGSFNKGKAPDTVGDEFVDVAEKAKETDDTLMLRFYFTKYMSSLFTKIPINDFDIGDIKYQVIYASSGEPVNNELYTLTEDLVDADCKRLLRQPGKHTIMVTLPLGEGVEPARGSFTLNLAAESEQLEFVTVTFALDGGQAYFGEVGNGEASIELQKGTKYTWADFEKDFVMKKADKILAGIQDGNNVFGPNSTSPITFTKNNRYTVLWKDNTVTVTFDLNLPKDAVIIDPNMEARVREETQDQQVVMNSGIVARPNAEILNSYHGYYFAGWRDKSDGKLWLFTQTVGKENINLIAQWTPRYYSLKIYTMGGAFVEHPAGSFQDKTDAQIEAEGYIFVDSDLVFDLTTGDVNEINFNGLKYNVTYDKYVSRLKFKKGSEDTVLIKITDILSILEKGNGIFQTEGIYRDEICTDRLQTTDKVLVDETTYVNWTMPDNILSDPELMSNYYVNYAFKDGISLKADGTLRLDRLYDVSVNELHIPAEIKWTDGIYHPLTEIGDKACLNAKSLVLLDLSNATNLIRLGDHSFALCKNLTTVTLPEASKNKISDIGEQAFASTHFEDNYFAINNKSYIVINNVIYKFVGELDENNPVLDLSTASFASNDVEYSVSAGCFAGATGLRSVTLSDNVVYIHNYAFRGLTELEEVVAGAQSKLYYAGENAFHGCDKLFSVDNEFVRDVNGDSARESIVIGSLLYRVVDKTLTAYNVGADIKAIAPSAFQGCTALANVTFADESKIANVGKDAFIETAWIRAEDKHGFTVVNGILANFYSEDFNNYDVTIPASATRIGEYAFNSYARYIKTIEFRDGVEHIDDYAFAGASSIRSFIFTDAVVTASGIAHVPTISSNAFANSKGELINGVKIYFPKEVINYLSTSDCKTHNPDWYELYRLYSSAFEEERISGVWVNTAVVPSAFIKTSTDAPIADNYVNGLVIESSSGIFKYDNLNLDDNEVAFINTEGEHILFFKYKGSTDHCHISEEFAHVFRYKVYNAIRGVDEPALTDPLDAEEKTSADNFWIEGFEGDIDGRDVPTFYTSHATLDLKTVFFCYKDVFYDDEKTLQENEAAGHFHKLAISQVTGYSPTAGRSSTVTFTVNFYGIGNYYLTMPYAGEKSKYVEINQKSAISIPLNGKSATYIRDTYVYLLGEDGREQKVVFNLNTFHLVDVDGVPTENLPTGELGMHLMHVTYQTEDTKGVINGYIAYSVVLEADNSAFSYEVVNENKKTARITKCTNSSSATLVLPDTCKIGGVEYVITEIGAGVFKDFTSLEEVYLPASLEKIGTEAFAGCTLLARVYTATQTPYAERRIYDENFEDINETVTQEGSVHITELLFTILPNTLTVPATVTWTTSETVVVNEGELNEYSYSRTTTYIATPIFADDVFARCKGTIWLFDSEYNRAYAAEHLNDKEVKFYTADDNKVPANQSKFKFDEDDFTATTITKVKNARLIRIDNLELDESGNIVITPSFVMPVVVENGVTIYETNYVVATADVLVAPDGFTDSSFLYLPNTIYNVCALEDALGTDISERLTIYKSGSETLVSTIYHAPETLEYIGSGAFEDCLSLGTIEFCANLETISARAFCGSGLSNLDLSGTKVLDINRQTFEGCAKLEVITLPLLYEIVGGNKEYGAIALNAFADCVNLARINYVGTKAEWANIVKDDDWDKFVGVVDKETTAYDKNYFVRCTDGDVTVQVLKSL